MSPDAPTRIAHFRIVGPLGCGGMGVVYRAEDETLRRIVALKLLPDASGDDERRQRFLREARSAAAITHPNVATVYQVGEADGRVFIAMELVPGENLRERLARGHLDLTTARDLGTQIARGLAAAHEQGIVHRDLKPENVMITPAGVVKLLDFGLAKAGAERSPAGRTEAALARTESVVTSDQGHILGTPEYMSPEQAIGAPLDVRSDVFSFGVVLYEMISGTRPFAGTTTGALLVAIARDEAAPLRPLAPDVDEATEGMVMRCLAKAPAERFASAGEVVAALASASPRSSTVSQGNAVVIPRSGDLEVTDPPVATGPTPTIPAPRRALVLPLAALVVVAIAGAWAVRRATATNASAATTTTAHASASAAPLSTIPEAARLYAEGTESWRIDSDMQGIGAWQRAVKLDPGLCPAQLRLTLYGCPYADVDCHGAFEAARRCAAKLDARDQAMLEMATRTLAQPPDMLALAAAVKRGADAFPDDPEIQYLCAALSQSDLAAAIGVFDHVIRLDPRFVHAYAAKADALEQLGKTEEAEQVLQACTAASPGSVLCGYKDVDLSLVSGRCSDAEAVARRFIANRPSSSAGYSWLSLALTARAAPKEAVEASLDQQLQREEPGTTGAYRTRTEFAQDAEATYGDFPAALELLDERDRGDAKLVSLYGRVKNAERRVAVLREMGRTDAARAAVQSILRRSDAYQADAEGETTTLVAQAAYLGVRPMSAVVDLAGRAPGFIPPDATPERRWAALYVWEDPPAVFARDAVAKLPVGADVQSVLVTMPPGEVALAARQIGTTLARGGRPDLAAPLLRDGLKGCMRSDEAFSRRHAELELGKALEAQGDKVGAREQYQSILRYWGEAKPRSVTADEARRRLAALGP